MAVMENCRDRRRPLPGTISFVGDIVSPIDVQ